MVGTSTKVDPVTGQKAIINPFTGQAFPGGQIEELKDKGVASNWLYPRFVYTEPLRSDPQYWSDGWLWVLVRFTMDENQRLGLVSWFSDWAKHRFIQNRIVLAEPSQLRAY